MRDPASRLALRLLCRSLLRRPRDLGWLAVWSLVEVLPAAVSGWAVAEAAGKFLAGRVWGGLAWLGLIAVAAAVGAAGARPGYRRLAALVEPLRDDLVRMIVSGALGAAEPGAVQHDTGAVARITHQAEIVRDTFAGLLTAARTFVFTAATALAGLLTLIPSALPFVVPPLAASLVLLHFLLRPLAARQRRSIVGEETVADVAGDAFAGLRDAAACGAEDQLATQIAGRVDQQAAAARGLARIGTLRTLSLAIGGWLPLVLLLAAAPALFRRGVTAAEIIGAVTYLGGSLHGALGTLTEGVAGSGVRLVITLGRIIEASGGTAEGTAAATREVPAAGAAPPERTVAATPARTAAGGAAAPAPEGGALTLRRVSFRYGPGAEPVIHDLSIDIADGDHLAIAGPSGIGKSTLAGLMAGLLRPDTGEVRIGGVPLPLIPAASVARLRVLHPQEAYVFAGTLKENLSYLNPGASAGDLDAAADAVGLRPLVDRLQGYRAELNPSSLSAGERQLIALTRAYLSPARIVILDEATCHLDPSAEATAEQAFALRAGTLIVIAHRMSSALRARRVLVLDGNRAQAGDHADLIASSPMYRDLVGHWVADGGAAVPAPSRSGPLGPLTAAPPR